MSVDTVNPSTGEKIKTYSFLKPEEIESAVGKAARSF